MTRPRPKRRKAAALKPERRTLTIAALGSQGDGLAETPGGRVAIPYTLPGETVSALVAGSRGAADDILTPSPQRIDPICPHFGTCGGCTLQHLDDAVVSEWKRAQVVRALTHHGLDAAVNETITVAVAARRRAVFALKRVGRRAVFGFRERRAHRIVDLDACPILLPALAKALPGLRAFLAPLAPSRGEARVSVLVSETGLDVAVEDGLEPDGPGLAALSDAARRCGVARLTLDGTPAIIHQAPRLKMGTARVVPPPGAFVQAAEEAEIALAEAVVTGLMGAARIADLYAGIGTFSLRLAERAPVLAVEGDADALKALDDAVRQTDGLKPVRTDRRDLARDPLTATELRSFDGLVFDPPRAGAAAQATEIARSDIRHVVAVSCNPATFARDMRVLVDGGYRLSQVTPVDQFRFAAHIEVVAHLEKG